MLTRDLSERLQDIESAIEASDLHVVTTGCVLTPRRQDMDP